MNARRFAFLPAILLLFVCAAEIQAAGRPLDFSTIGFYGTWLKIGDFGFLKFTYAKPDDARRIDGYRQILRRAAAAGQTVILGLYTFDRVTHKRPIEEYVANTNALLSALPRELIYAACPSEENVTWNNGLRVLNALYECIHGKWHLPCYQWLTMPDPPHGKLKADGWIFDAYGMTRGRFRRHLAKFVVTGKPVVVCVNATPPSSRYAAEKILPGAPGSPAEDQMRVCEEFNLPVFFYAVDRELGSVAKWMSDKDPETTACRRWAVGWIKRAHAQRGRRGPAPTANHLSARTMQIRIGKDGCFAVAYDFSNASFLDYAGVDGLLRLRWDGFAEKLLLRGGRKAQAARLAWHIKSPMEIRALQVEATGRASKGAVVQVGVGKDLRHLLAAKYCSRTGQSFTAKQAMPRRRRGREAWVSVELRAPAGGSVALSRIEISGAVEQPTGPGKSS